MARRGVTVFALVCLGATTLGVAPASAAAPANDTEATARVVSGIGFVDEVDAEDATPGGPRFCSNHASVFYRFTPAASGRVQVDTLGSGYDTTLAVYTRDADGRVVQVACNDDRFGWDAGVRFEAIAGTEYVFMVARCCGDHEEGRRVRKGGWLVFAVTEVVEAPLEVSLEVIGSGAVDPETGDATISGTLSCTKRSRVYYDGELRQIRDGLFVAEGYWYQSVVCSPGGPVAWSFDIESETSVVFGAGPATFRMSYGDAWAGWRDGADLDPVEVRVQLVAA